MGNDLNTSMAVTLLYDALKAKASGATRLAILDSFDQVLSLSLLDKAAAVREEQAKVKAAQAQAGYTVDRRRGPRDRRSGEGPGRGQEGQGLSRGRPHP